MPVLYILSVDDSGRSLHNPREVTQSSADKMNKYASEKIRPSESLELYIFQILTKDCNSTESTKEETSERAAEQAKKSRNDIRVPFIAHFLTIASVHLVVAIEIVANNQSRRCAINNLRTRIQGALEDEGLGVMQYLADPNLLK